MADDWLAGIPTSDLSDFVATLRASLFASQVEASRRLGLDRTAISKYEQGEYCPPIGYIARLAQMHLEQSTRGKHDASRASQIMVVQMNRLLRRYYPDEPPLHDWRELCRVAEEYTALRQAKRLAARSQSFPRRTPWVRVPRASRGQHLPPKLYTVFRGRKRALAHIVRLLLDAKGLPIVSVSGGGGNGKTTLAREAVDRVVHTTHFADVLWVSAQRRTLVAGALQMVTDFQLDPANLVDQLILQTGLAGLTLEDADAKRHALADLFNAKRFLIVLDNLDESKDEVALVRQLVGFMGRAKVLVTTRHRTIDALPQVRPFPLAGFGATESVQFLRGEAAARGFNELARTARETLSQVYHATAGMPLALDLVIGQAQMLSLETALNNLRIPSQLDEDFYTYLFEADWTLLSEPAKRLLIFLARMIQNPVSERDLRQMMAVHLDFDAALESLVKLSLVETQTGLTQEAKHYGLHPLTRQFVLGLESALRNQPELAAFFAEGCLRPAAAGWLEICRTNSQVLTQYNARTNILFCAAKCLIQKHAEAVCDFWEGLSTALYHYGFFDEYARLAQQTLSAAHELGRADLEADVHSDLGWLALVKHEFPQAQTFIERALQHYVATGDLRKIFIARRYLATIDTFREDHAAAAEKFEALRADVRQALGAADPETRSALERQLITLHDSLGCALLEMGELAQAERELEAGLAGAPQFSETATTISLINLARLRIKQSRLDQASDLLQQALANCDAQGFTPLAAEALYWSAHVAELWNNVRLARQLGRQAVRIYHHHGDNQNEKRVREYLATLRREGRRSI